MKPNSPLQKILLQTTIALTGGFLLFLIILGVAIAGFHIQYKDRIYPGVSISGVDLSGKTRPEAAALLANEFTYPITGKIVLQDQNTIWEATPSDFGLFFAPNQNAEAAYQVGRSGKVLDRWSTQLRAYRHGVSLPPQFVWDEATAHRVLTTLAEQINLPTLEATLHLEGLGVVAQAGQIGRALDIPLTLRNLHAHFQARQDGHITLPVEENPPEILDVSEPANFLREILSQALTLEVPAAGEGDAGPWAFSPETVAGMLTLERLTGPEGAEYAITFKAQLWQAVLADIGQQIARDPQNARFIFNDESGELEVIQQEVIGRSLNIEQTLASIYSSLQAGQHTVALALEYTEPPVTSASTAQDLGITGLINSEMSFFYYSSSARMHNIETASAQFHGVLVAPGETFSMGEILGDVSAATGYEEAWIIAGNRTVKGVGGGVCQVSTTLFRTVFFSGLPVNQRHFHAYRVMYYEQTPSGGHDSNLAGLDATVYFPSVDFKFTNDTGHWLLMETYVNIAHRTLTWKFYGTSDGRTMQWETTGLQNITEPGDPIYIENEDFKKGEIEQVDWAVDGADVTVTRHVYRGDQKLWTDIFETHYAPWRAVCEYGPGTEGMPPDDINENKPCEPSG